MTKMTISTIGIEKNPKTYSMALMDHPKGNRNSTVESWRLLPLTEFRHVQNSLCVQVLHSPILAAILHGIRPVCVSQTLRR